MIFYLLEIVMQFKLTASSFSLLAVTLSTYAAEPLIPMSMTGQPQITMDQGVPVACGTRIVGIESREILEKEAVWVFDGSFMIRREGYGSLKGYLSRPTQKQAAGGQFWTPVAIRNFWFRAPGEVATKSLNGRVIDSDTVGAKLYASDTVSTLTVQRAILRGEPIQIGIELSRGQDSRIFFGEVVLSEAQKKQISSCIADMSIPSGGK